MTAVTDTDTFTTTPVEQARWRTADHVLAVARLLDGDGAIVRGETPWGTPQHDAAPLAGIRAAVFVERNAAGRAKDYARAARGEGHTWDEIGEAFGLGKLAEDAGQDLGEAAWAYLADGTLPQVDRGFSSWRDCVSWKCGACGQRVTDRGPFNGHPTDCESGHDEFCTRHRADLAAWRCWDEQ